MSIFRDDILEKEKIRKEAIVKYEEEQEQQIISRYNEDYSNRQKMIKPFTEIFAEIVGTDTYNEFQDKTGLGPTMFYNLRKWVGRKKPCSKSTIVSVCVGYDVGLKIAEELLRSQGSAFNPHNKIDSAYIMLLSEYRGRTVDECNVLLEKLEIKKEDRLGTCARRPRKSKRKK